MQEIWLVPHRDGMFRYRIERDDYPLSRQAAVMAETLARRPGELVTIEAMAEAVWPGRWPEGFKHRLEDLMVSIRRALPAGYVKTEYRKLSRWAWPRTRGALIGWRLAGTIHIHPSP